MSALDTEVTPDEVTGQDGEQPKQRLNLDVKVEQKSACERHVTVTIPREDIDRYLNEAFDELAPKAEVPGFRPGRAPRKLVQSRFKEKIEEQVKGALLLDSLQQITSEQQFSAISEPDFDFGAVEIPPEGPMSFEFNLEVRPEFTMPEWKGLKLDRPTYKYTDGDVNRHMERLLAKYGQLVPQDRPVQAGDYVVCNVTFRHGDQTIREEKEQSFRVLPRLSFQDAVLEGFDKLMVGANSGEKKTTTVRIGDAVENESLRGQTVEVTFEVLDVKQIELPRVTPAILEEMGGFQSEEELRNAVLDELERQFRFHQHRHLRAQITGQLLRGANWELPKSLLQRQSYREIERLVMELQASGFSPQDIQKHENSIRRRGLETTAVALKEHFILERIAEENAIDAVPEDFDREIELIAEQSDDSPRRVRARLEKKGQMDSLRNQIVERKVIELILANAQVKEVPFQPEADEAHAVDFAISGTNKAEIPEAKYAGEAEDIRGVKK